MSGVGCVNLVRGQSLTDEDASEALLVPRKLTRQVADYKFQAREV